MKTLLTIKKKHNLIHKKDTKKRHPRQRMVVEHTIYRIKKFHIIENKCRNKLKRYDIMSYIGFVLVNYVIT